MVHEVGGPFAAQAEKAPHRDSRDLSAQVVERHVHGSLRRVLAGEGCEPLLDLVEGERVVAEQGLGLRQKSRRRLDALPVVLLRRGLPVPDEAVVLDLDEHRIHGLVGRARDGERLAERERHRPVGQLHGGTLSPTRL